MKRSLTKTRACGVVVAPMLLLGLLACSSSSTAPSGTTWKQGDLPFDISADNRFILYQHWASQEGPQGVYMLDRESEDPPTLLWEFESNLKSPNDPRFSPDATKLVMTRDLVRDIYLYDIATGEETQLTFTSGNAKKPDWHPDGKAISYAAWFCSGGQVDSTCGLFILDIETGTPTQIRHRGEWFGVLDPRWSPDGSRIAFSNGEGIWTITPDGTSLVSHTPGSSRDNTQPQWISNHEILFLSKSRQVAGEGRDLIVDIYTGEIRPLGALMPFRFTRRVLSRDGKYVVYNDGDPAGEYGVLYIQKADDARGYTRQQLTTFSPIKDVNER